jgi:HEAT repeat protein
MPPDDAVRWLTPALSSPDAGVRREAAGALGRLRGTAAINAATKLVGDADPHVQREAIEALGRLLRSSDAEAARSALPVLQQALQHDNPDVRRQLVETLGSLHSIADEVVPLLAQAAEDPDPNVQREAVEALGRISSRGSLHEEWIGDFVENEINEFQWEGMEDAKRALVEIQVDNEENLEAPTKTQP